MSRYVSRADLARLLGVSRPAITKRCQGSWAAACHGDRVDLDHPLIVAACVAKGVSAPATDEPPAEAPEPSEDTLPAPTNLSEFNATRTAKPTERRRATEPLPPQPGNAGSDEDLEQLAEALRPLVARFGVERGFRDWLLGLKDIETITGKRLENAQTKGLLVPRDFVKTHVFGAIEGTNHRLLSDTPKTLCRELYALAKTNRPLEEAEQFARKLLGRQLESVKSRVVKALRDA